MGFFWLQQAMKESIGYNTTRIAKMSIPLAVFWQIRFVANGTTFIAHAKILKYYVAGSSG
jgi:hypothetical protein